VSPIGTDEFAAPSASTAAAERRELDWLLTSGVLGRSGNLARVLTYICEEHFAGRAEHIKEYTIATEALGRRADFDSNSDTIVRVTVHSLRKRLLEVYQNEGATRPIRLILPPGRYDPRFVPATLLQPPTPIKELIPDTNANSGHVPLNPPAVSGESTQPSGTTGRRRLAAFITASVFVLVVTFWGWHLHRANSSQSSDFLSASGSLPAPVPQATIRALMGPARKPYTDHSGITWSAANYCQGGSNVAVPPQKIAGTDDPPLYFGGVRGIAHCIFPVTQKLYELHFYFAETTDLLAATRVANISINAGPAINIDVVDRAGGDGIATSIVVTGIVPENDGSIHIDLTSEVSLLNAVELLPAPSSDLLPVRIVASSKSFVDGADQFWESDRYFSGGRHGLPAESTKEENLGLYKADRVGRFTYSIPAVPRAHYDVTLYFREPWFGKENGGAGGPGSRVFNVVCNGQMLMKDFDILAVAGASPAVRTFNNLEATADGRIDLSFLPVVNYAVVSAIEMVPTKE